VTQIKKWKHQHENPKFASTFDEVLLRLQNQVNQDTALSRVRDCAQSQIFRGLAPLQPFHLSADKKRISDLLGDAIASRFHIRSFSREVMAQTMDVIELDLLRIHYLILDSLVWNPLFLFIFCVCFAFALFVFVSMMFRLLMEKKMKMKLKRKTARKDPHSRSFFSFFLQNNFFSFLFFFP